MSDQPSVVIVELPVDEIAAGLAKQPIKCEGCGKFVSLSNDPHLIWQSEQYDYFDCDSRSRWVVGCGHCTPGKV